MSDCSVGGVRMRPGSLVPDEDQGYYIAAVILPDGASLQRTDKVVSEVVRRIQSNPNNQDEHCLRTVSDDARPSTWSIDGSRRGVISALPQAVHEVARLAAVAFFLDQAVDVRLAGGADYHDVVGAVAGGHAHPPHVVL